MLHCQSRRRDRDKLLHTSDLALLPAVHVSSDEPSKATDEHTLLIPLNDDQPKAPSCVPAFELSEAFHQALRDSAQYFPTVEPYWD